MLHRQECVGGIRNLLIKGTKYVSYVTRVNANGIPLDRSVSSTVQTRASWANRQFNQTAMGLHSEDSSVVEDKMLQVWTLDSATTCSIAANEKLVDNVRFTKDKIELNTNAGSKIIDEVCDVENIGTIRFNKDGIANILGLCDLKKKYRVTLDSYRKR
eukprot:scaffold3071_cov84-Cylindrotheca_fusiformis.AAC.1